jgi:hypothetical protein
MNQTPDTLISDFINRFVESNKHLAETGDNINPRALDQRQSLLSQLNTMIEVLNSGVVRLKSMSAMVSKVQAEEIAALDSILGRVRKPKPLEVKSNPDWKLVQKKRVTDIIKTERTPIKMPLQLPGSQQRIKITNEISLNAIPVNSFGDVMSDGSLYYVTPASHFAVSINGMLLHGNIGIIYTNAEVPVKIKECRFTDGCIRMSTCSYYHDPTLFPGSKDHRNFIASSFMYNGPHTYRNRAARHFGSLDNLDSDILSLSDEEKNRTLDQAMHDLLCALVIKSITKK